MSRRNDMDAAPALKQYAAGLLFAAEVAEAASRSAHGDHGAA
jgi:hypothetical protein